MTNTPPKRGRGRPRKYIRLPLDLVEANQNMLAGMPAGTPANGDGGSYNNNPQDIIPPKLPPISIKNPETDSNSPVDPDSKPVVETGEVKGQSTPTVPVPPFKEAKKPQIIDISLSKKQYEAFSAKDRFVLYGGAKGGGKSWLLCLWLFTKAVENPGNKIFACRKRSVDFTNTTLETWKKSIPGNLYRINEQKKKIYIDKVKSVIDYGGLDDPMLVQSLNSAEYAHIGVDQAEEVERDSFAMLRGTLRHRLPSGKFPNYQIMLTANPAQCWLKDEFILKSSEGFKFIPALPSDNPYLPQDYTENLKEAFKHRPSLLQAYLYGSWDDLASNDICIQPSWVQAACDRAYSGNPIKRVIVNDPARFGDDENVIYVMEQTKEHAYIVDELVLEHKSLMDTAGRLVALRKKHQANLIAVDVIGIGAGIVDALNELREPVYAINSSAKPTIETELKKYHNLRTQMWMEAGLKFSEGKVVLDQEDTLLRGQLSTTKFKFTNNGRVQAESKDDIKKRLGRSPDRGDAFVMGLLALDKAERLDQSQIDESETDRVGHGTPIEVEETLSPTGNFSGYSFAE